MNQSNSQQPLVSIGVPVYNADEFLSESLDSLLAQTYDNIEIVISDNASTDQTAEICRLYAEKDKRIRYVRESQNKGSNWNFSRVFHLSNGKYFKWAACDDLCDPEFVARCVEVLENDLSVVCCHSRTMTINEYGNEIKGFPDPTDGGQEKDNIRHRRDGSSHYFSRRFGDVLLSSGWGVRCSGVFKSEALGKTGLMQSFYGSEKLMMAELAVHGRFWDLPQMLFSQRVHSGSISGATRESKNSAIRKRIIHTPLLRQFSGYLSVAMDSGNDASTKLKCIFWLIVYLFQYKKWWLIAETRLNNIVSRVSPKIA
ncbi:MAG: glycosyltransferase family A protein [Pseudomonadota bacterium]